MFLTFDVVNSVGQENMKESGQRQWTDIDKGSRNMICIKDKSLFGITINSAIEQDYE